MNGSSSDGRTTPRTAPTFAAAVPDSAAASAVEGSLNASVSEEPAEEAPIEDAREQPDGHRERRAIATIVRGRAFSTWTASSISPVGVNGSNAGTPPSWPPRQNAGVEGYSPETYGDAIADV